jgi:hypothetical protein
MGLLSLKGPLIHAELVSFKGEHQAFVLVLPSLEMLDVYQGPIEPLIAIVLGCMRRKRAQAHEVRQ